MDVISSLGFIVGILGLAYAFLQSYQSRKAAQESRKATASLNSSLGLIEGSLSTRYLGPGPSLLTNICEKLSRAESEIIIVCAVPGFGYFSDFQQWTRYKSEIERKVAAGVQVKIVCLNEQQREYFHRFQFPREGPEWDNWLKDESYDVPAKMALFLKHEHEDFLEHEVKWLTKEVAAADRFIRLEDFLVLLERSHQRIIRYDFRNAQVIETDKHLGVYLWLVDSRSAVFAIPDFGAGTMLIGFETSDKQLISAFKAVAAECSKKGSAPLLRLQPHNRGRVGIASTASDGIENRSGEPLRREPEN